MRCLPERSAATSTSLPNDGGQRFTRELALNRTPDSCSFGSERLCQSSGKLNAAAAPPWR